MSKTYIVDVRYYIPADNDDELCEMMKGLSYNEYYGGYDVVEVEENDDEENEDEE